LYEKLKVDSFIDQILEIATVPNLLGEGTLEIIK